MSKKFEVTFNDWIEADTEEEAWDKLLDYLSECVQYRDVTVFEFKEKEV
jgi:ATP-dependent Zn protease